MSPRERYVLIAFKYLYVPPVVKTPDFTILGIKGTNENMSTKSRYARSRRFEAQENRLHPLARIRGTPFSPPPLPIEMIRLEGTRATNVSYEWVVSERFY